MNFKKIANAFHEHAKEISATDDQSARFRARNYERVAKLLEQKFDGADKPTRDKIKELKLTDFMQEKIFKVIKDKGFQTRNGLEAQTRKVDKTRKVETKTNSKLKITPVKKLTNKKKLQASSPFLEKDKEKLTKELIGFMGIGIPRAKELIDEGLTHINQLHMKKWFDKLPIETQTFIKLKPISPIPHDDIATLEPYLLKLQNKDLKIRIVGSYRRNTKQSNDIDVMIVSNDDDAVETFHKQLSKRFNGKVFPYSKGLNKMSLIIDMTDLLNLSDVESDNENITSNSKKNKKINRIVYKLDVFRVEPENEIPMLLYSTGSKDHNILMRRKAKSLSMLLNQNGLFKKNKDKLIKISNLNTEEDYFTALDIEYKNPEDRL
jgi:hypothetical protein